MRSLEVAQVSEAERRAEVFAQVTPVLFGNGAENFDDLGIELRSRATTNFFAGVGHRQSFAIRAVADHGVQRVGNGEYAGAERNLVALQAAGITGAVVEFLVRENNFGGIAQE